MYLRTSVHVPSTVLSQLTVEARLQSWLHFEAALAVVQAELGLIPVDAAAVISENATLARVPLAEVEKRSSEMGLATAAMVKMLTEACGQPYGEYVHWGATTTDVTETGLSLQVSPVLSYLVDSLDDLLDRLAKLADTYRHTLGVARTHGQHALPITFGYKVSLWGHEILWARERLCESRDWFLVCKATGAAGNHASFGADGQLLQQRLSERLGLRVSDPSIQISRNRIVNLLASLSILGNSLYHMAQDIRTCQRPEIGEIEEQYAVGVQRGSSTLPAKRNPFTAELICSYVHLLHRNTAAELTLVPQDERDSVALSVESTTVAEALSCTAATLSLAVSLVNKLVAYPERMLANLHLTGTAMAESVMMTLARNVGRQKAYELVYRAANEARSSGKALKEVMNGVLQGTLARQEIESLWDYRQYLGSAENQIDSFLEKSARSKRNSHG